MTTFRFAAIAAASLTMLTATTGSAAVMTFENLIYDPSNTTTYVEDGITAIGNGDVNPGTTGGVVMADNGTPISTKITFTTGGLFHPVSFDYGTIRFDPPVEYVNIGVTGTLNGETTQIAEFSSNDLFSGANTFNFATDLVLDSLTITNLRHPTNTVCSPCSEIELDNVRLEAVSEVPTPESLPLLAAAVGMIAYGARKRRKSA